MKIAVVGLGHVGLPLSLQCAQSCVSMIRLDVDAKKVQLLNNGQSYIRHIRPSAIAELVGSGKFSASTELSRIKDVEPVLICVATPLSKTSASTGTPPRQVSGALKPYAGFDPALLVGISDDERGEVNRVWQARQSHLLEELGEPLR